MLEVSGGLNSCFWMEQFAATKSEQNDEIKYDCDKLMTFNDK